MSSAQTTTEIVKTAPPVGVTAAVYIGGLTDEQGGGGDAATPRAAARTPVPSAHNEY
ncbi:hypothetical protein GCM10007159_42050 [Modicisalibacter luteus]|nr:hypothetical protein GCM10007159_42050 [Halomonas lutea]